MPARPKTEVISLTREVPFVRKKFDITQTHLAPHCIGAAPLAGGIAVYDGNWNGLILPYETLLHLFVEKVKSVLNLTLNAAFSPSIPVQGEKIVEKVKE